MEQSSEEKSIDRQGQCFCGAVKFHVMGTTIFNQLCHCRACGRARGMTPVHLIGIKGRFTINEGQFKVKTINGMGTMTHTICSDCGGGLYQRPHGRDFYATFPTNFQIETDLKKDDDDDVPSSFLPRSLQPTCHTNYENRLFNFYDALPKYKTFASSGGSRMTNDGLLVVD